MRIERKDLMALMLVLTCINLIWYSCVMLFFTKREKRSMINKHAVITNAREFAETSEAERDEETSLEEAENAMKMVAATDTAHAEFLGSTDFSQAIRVKNQIKGSTYRTDGGAIYSFQTNGTFSGFFDSKNKNVSNFRYEFAGYGDTVLLNIYNRDKSSVVSYQIRNHAYDAFELYYQPADARIRIHK